MADNIHIKLPDGSDKEMPRGATALDVARSISSRLAEAAIVAKMRPLWGNGSHTLFQGKPSFEIALFKNAVEGVQSVS